MLPHVLGLAGFGKVCSGDAMDMFMPDELELLICGNPSLDFDALEKGTRYDDGYTNIHPQIRNFWSIVHQFSDEEKKALLKFVSGSDRAPIDGTLAQTPVRLRSLLRASDPDECSCLNTNANACA
jgi:hypothetical protein